MTPIPYSTVAAAPSPGISGTALSVFAGSGGRFTAVPFFAYVWAAGLGEPLVSNFERVEVTDVIGDVFTIVRSASPRDIQVGDQLADESVVGHLYDAHIPALASITNPFIAGDAAIAYSKLALTGSIVNADVVSLSWSKLTGAPTTLAGYGIASPLPISQGGTALATLTAHAIYVGNGVGVPTALTVGATGSVLTGVSGADPVWSAVPTLTEIILSAFNGATPILFVQHDPTIAGTVGTAVGNTGGVKFGAIYQSVQFTDGPVGEPIYIDDTWHIGPNVGPNVDAIGIGRADPTKPAFEISFESRYFDGTRFAAEFHVQGISADGLTTFRPMSIQMAADGTYTAVAYKADSFLVQDRSSAAMVQINKAAGTLDLGVSAQPIKIRFNKNNVSAIQQLNSTGSFVDLLYLDGSNIATIAAPLDIVAARQSANFCTIQPTTANSNDTGIVVVAPSLTGTFNAFRCQGAITGFLRFELENTVANSGAHAQIRMVVDTGSGGDPQALFSVADTTQWSIGVDNSDSDKFVLCQASSLSSNFFLTMTTAGLLGIGVSSPTARLHLKAGTATANTAPLKFTSGAVLTSAETGALEFLTDDYFATITTGSARKAFVLDDGARLTSGKIPVASTNGRLIDGPTLGAAGLKIPAIQAAGTADAQTAAVASVTTFNLSAANGLVLIAANVNVTSSVLHSFSVQVDYTDETNTAQTETLTFTQLNAASVSVITNGTGAGPYQGVVVTLRCKASTAVTVKTTGTFTSVTYNVAAALVQLT